MFAKKKPRKPSQPLGHVIFRKRRRPYAVMERLSLSKEELEATIVKKFIGALKHFEGRSLSLPEKADPWPDFVCEEAGAKIGIEVVEVINIDHAAKRSRQRDYAAYIRKLIDDCYTRLSGLMIILDDGYQEPSYPPIAKLAGKKLAKSITDNIRSILEQLENIPLNGIRVYHWQKGPHHPTIGAIVRRVAIKENGIPATLGFFGTFPENVSIIESLFCKTIKGKLDKKYTEFIGDKLILLAYEVGSCSVAASNSTAVRLAQNEIRRNINPFTEVWYIFPYAPMGLEHKDLGHIVKVWP